MEFIKHFEYIFQTTTQSFIGNRGSRRRLTDIIDVRRYNTAVCLFKSSKDRKESNRLWARVNQNLYSKDWMRFQSDNPFNVGRVGSNDFWIDVVVCCLMELNVNVTWINKSSVMLCTSTIEVCVCIVVL